MVTVLYDEILRMILKQIRYDSATNFSNFQPANLIPSVSEVLPTGDTDLTNAYNVVKLENYDYHLDYDSDEVFTSFTSNNRKWRWNLCSDSFGDLTHITVLNPYIPFVIAMIWVNYDIRRSDPETEDKGLLTDIVLLSFDGTPLFTSITIDPKIITCEPGGGTKFSATLLLQDGTELDVTDSAGWSIVNCPNGMSIQQGYVSNAQTGTWTIVATVQGKQATATLIVVPVTLTIDPESSTVLPGQRVQYTVYLTNGNTKTPISWKECSWSISSVNGTDPIPNMQDGLVTNDSYPGGTYIISGIYNGNTITASLSILMPVILVDPAIITISEGDNAHFDSLLKLGNTVSTVTEKCTWSIDPTGPIINNLGNVTNTHDAQGSYNITASYVYESTVIYGTGVLTIKDAQFWIEPPTAKVNIEQTHKYIAYYKDGDGLQHDVTNECTWTIESPCIIDKNGLATAGSSPGTFGINAMYEGKKSNATLEVILPRLEIRENSQQIKLGESAIYRAYFVDCTGEVDLTDVVIWYTSATNSTISKGNIYNNYIPGTFSINAVITQSGKTYTATGTLVVLDITLIVDPSTQTVDIGTIANVRALADGVDVTLLATWTKNGVSVPGFQGRVSVDSTNSITMIASYHGKTANGIILVISKTLVILPGNYSISIGETCSFRSYLRAPGYADVDVTNLCTWNIDSPLTITQTGAVGNTIRVGSYNVSAKLISAPSLVATASVVISEHTFNVHTLTVILQFRDNSDVDGDAISVWVNDSIILNNYQLTGDWKDVTCVLKSGSNKIKLGATGNGRIWYYNPSYGPNYGSGMVTAAVRGKDANTSVVVIPETLLDIDAPTRGSERLNLDPNLYCKIWDITVT